MPLISTITTPLVNNLRSLLLAGAAYANPRSLTVSKLGRLLAVLIVLANLKVIPFFWHSRFWYALYTHLLLRRRILPNPTQLFAPVKIVARAPLYECDFNYHKSNSTYFSDLDIARTHLVAHLIKKSLRLRRQRGDKPLYVALGGVMSLFRREIKPYEKYEVWSRVLGWDNKWFFVVSHFVSAKGDPKHGGKRKIYASSLSKYVFKVERKTIPPNEVLEESGLLPKKPEAPVLVEDSKMAKPAGLMESADLIVKTEVLHPHLQHLDTESNAGSDAGTSTPAILKQSSSDDDLAIEEEQLELVDKITKWDWETVERLRKQGLKTAHHMLGLDALEGEFEKGNERVGNRVSGYPASILGLSWA
ncbi:hypothetical protein TWF106_002230 [Orbilia oligospora]|uniref:Thioesterase n=1 Tax=Orbilia oligospora TaxID=2813651 RepID=A0A6G1LZ73_ORBOL|nr:hypothetical protein TWF788_009358 [Orbilia oligospora]KAF3202387.1 hypothetical protein TWF191_002952 [Orbilia oligospora]KAF3202901.1 hypothetical protein TWF106_002230 [Orbilia oligospora]KAF3223611.1 hypothetical protein TWF679_000056 [Orbilia oligospora]KAF3239695.1 hypothetical protein TWF192_009931 [Orbilia oligospora]